MYKRLQRYAYLELSTQHLLECFDDYNISDLRHWLNLYSKLSCLFYLPILYIYLLLSPWNCVHLSQKASFSHNENIEYEGIQIDQWTWMKNVQLLENIIHESLSPKTYRCLVVGIILKCICSRLQTLICKLNQEIWKQDYLLNRTWFCTLYWAWTVRTIFFCNCWDFEKRWVLSSWPYLNRL